MTYVIKFKNGQVEKEGSGLSFFYYAPTTFPVGTNSKTQAKLTRLKT